MHHIAKFEEKEVRFGSSCLVDSSFRLNQIERTCK